MSSTIRVNTIQDANGQNGIAVADLTPGVIQTHRSNYTGGAWNPDTTYRTIPGSNVTFTPQRSNSKIRYRFNFASYWSNSNHAITHIIMYRGSVEQMRWSFGAQYWESRNDIEWVMDSWGTSAQEIYLSLRSYTNDGHEIRIHGTHYWNGGGSVQNAYAQLEVTEFME